MKDRAERRLPGWPLWTALSLLALVEIFFLVMLFGEGKTSNLQNIINSFGILAFCVMIWMRRYWSRWVLLAFLGWRIVGIGISLSSHYGDHRTPGSLILIGFYIVVGLVIASPLGKAKLRSSD